MKTRYVFVPPPATLITGTTVTGRAQQVGDKEMSPEVSMVYDFGATLVKKAGRMLLRAAFVRDDNPNVDNAVKGLSFAMLSG
jgi:hypothetical protein